MSDVIAAISTGHQLSAIGIIRLSGDGCAEVVQRVFSLRSGLPITQAPNRKLCIGTLHDRRGRVIDQALAVYTRGPNSYTGEDTLELHCHGSPAVLAAGLEALFQAGARQAGPGEFTKRAFLNGRMDLTQAEAVIDLIEAETADAAANAAMQVGGALSQTLVPICEQLTDICSHFQAVVDYPDEDIPAFELEEQRDTLLQIDLQLQKILDSFARGSFLRNGVKTVLLGRPNVGKSSLLNTLAGFERVIVTDIAGTTRDTVEQRVKLGGVLLRLIDTAGIRKTTDTIEELGVKRSREAAEDCDLALFVCDGSCPLNEEDALAISVAQRARQRIALINKSDLPSLLAAEQLPFDTVIPVSAKTGMGLEELQRQIAQRFGNETSCDGSILTNTRQAGALSRGRQSLQNAANAIASGLTPDAVLLDVEEALAAIGEVDGSTVRQTIIDRIFERFCVGK